jgi:hypothetical protein
MRNIPQSVDEVTRHRSIKIARALAEQSEPVTLHYTKRNGASSTSTGFVHEFAGVVGFDTFSVVLMTEDKGPRTINLCRVKSISKPVN